MNIQTKLNVGDEGYYIRFDKVVCNKVVSINASVINPPPDKAHILYKLSDGVGYHEIDEHYIFPTKEELLESL